MAWVAAEFSEAAKLRIKEAARFEKRIRLEALLGLPTEIASFRLRPLTGNDILQLQYAENGIYCGGKLGYDDFAQLVLLLKTRDEQRTDKRLLCELAKIWDDKYFQDDILTFMEHSFNDVPSFGGETTSDQVNFSSSTFFPSLIDLIASEYGWSFDEIMQKPISVILQMEQQILKRNLGNKYAIRNPITQAAKAAAMQGKYDG